MPLQWLRDLILYCSWRKLTTFILMGEWSEARHKSDMYTLHWDSFLKCSTIMMKSLLSLEQTTSILSVNLQLGTQWEVPGSWHQWRWSSSASRHSLVRPSWLDRGWIHVCFNDLMPQCLSIYSLSETRRTDTAFKDHSNSFPSTRLSKGHLQLLANPLHLFPPSNNFGRISLNRGVPEIGVVQNKSI